MTEHVKEMVKKRTDLLHFVLLCQRRQSGVSDYYWGTETRQDIMEVGEKAEEAVMRSETGRDQNALTN